MESRGTRRYRDEQCRQGRNSRGVVGTRSKGYRNSRRTVINRLVKQLCEEEEVGFVNLCDGLVGKEEMFMKDGLHLERGCCSC